MIIREYDSEPESKDELTIRFEVSANSLKMMDSSVANMEGGKVSPALDLSEFEKLTMT